MKVTTSLADTPALPSPIALAIGVFDGVHLGHLALIKHLHKLTRKGGTRVLLTFSNHPIQILRSQAPPPLLLSLGHRLYLLEKYGINLTIVLPFTKELSEMSYSHFFQFLHSTLPFTALVMGEGATFGKGREGNSSTLKGLSKEMGFELHVLKKESYHKETISSSQIRSLVEKGELKKIKKLLGRPYSLWRPLPLEEIKQENEALFSWTFEESHLCHLPQGVYGVDLQGEEETLPAVAFLRTKHELHLPSLCVTIYLEKKPLKSGPFFICFVQYMHRDIDRILSLIPLSFPFLHQTKIEV